MNCGVPVHTVVKMSMLIFWDVTPYGTVCRYQCLGRTYCLHLQGVRPQNGSSILLQNADLYLQVHAVLQHIILASTTVHIAVV
jgi:hypothetical protein